MTITNLYFSLSFITVIDLHLFRSILTIKLLKITLTTAATWPQTPASFFANNGHKTFGRSFGNAATFLWSDNILQPLSVPSK